MKPLDFLSSPDLRPTKGAILWSKASDDVEIRLGLWPQGHKGTVLLFTGRTEFIEKYGPAARVLNAAGYAVATLDWRCQGLSDRLTERPLVGHVDAFSDYQRDVALLLDETKAAGLPEPYFLMAHSMGGAIGLRSLIDGLDVRAAVFSAPMWGLPVSLLLRPVAFAIGHGSKILGLTHLPAPFTDKELYVETEAFEDNTLTHDPEMWAFMRDVVREHPGLGLAGPSCGWAHQAFQELSELNVAPLPNVPTWTTVGHDETVVDRQAIIRLSARWPACQLTQFPDCRHEIMMEVPELRDDFFDRAVAHFDTAH